MVTCEATEFFIDGHGGFCQSMSKMMVERDGKSWEKPWGGSVKSHEWTARFASKKNRANWANEWMCKKSLVARLCVLMRVTANREDKNKSRRCAMEMFVDVRIIFVSAC